jgi:hypothetical protein
MYYTSFVNRGIHGFISHNYNRKAYRSAKNARLCYSPARKPKLPVPEFGI